MKPAPEIIQELVQARYVAIIKNDQEKALKIERQLSDNLGIILEDTDHGTAWKNKTNNTQT